MSFRIKFVALLAALALGGCGLQPIKPKESLVMQTEQRPPPLPQLNWSPLDATMICIGDRLREASVQPVTIGYAVADSSGKTGVDFGLMADSTFGKISARGNNVYYTNMGFGSSARPEVMSVEEKRILQNPALLEAMTPVDWLLYGGVVSFTSGAVTRQTSGGGSGRDAEIGLSATASVDSVDLRFNFKQARTGVSFPGGVDVRVEYQRMSTAVDGGAFVAFLLNGMQRGAGIRLARSASLEQKAGDAIKVGMEFAVAMLLSQRYGIELATCPMHTPTPLDKIPERKRLPAIGELPAIWKAMGSPEARIRWFQATLGAMGYAPGSASGRLDAQTIAAVKRLQVDLGMPPTGTPGLDTFIVVAQQQLAKGVDPREPMLPDPTPRLVKIQLQQPNAPYAAGSPLRATVVVPRSGHLRCFLADPEGAGPIWPHKTGRGDFATASAPTLLPDNNASGPHPAIRLTTVGQHELWCGLTGSDITAQLPPALRPGGTGEGFQNMALVRNAFIRAAGSSLIADGSTAFAVVAPKPR